MNQYTKIGNTQRPHGTKGEVKIFIEEEFEDLFDEAELVFLKIRGKMMPYFIEECRGTKLNILKFEDIDSRNDAAEVASKDVYFRTADIPEDLLEIETLAYQFLIGFKMIDKANGILGTITNVEEYPSQEMAIVSNEEREILIPITEAYIVSIDEAAKQITVDLPDGLIDIDEDED